MKTLLALLLCMTAALIQRRQRLNSHHKARVALGWKKAQGTAARIALLADRDLPHRRLSASRCRTDRLTTDFSGKAWLFTLGPKDSATPGATKVAELVPCFPFRHLNISCRS